MRGPDFFLPAEDNAAWIRRMIAGVRAFESHFGVALDREHSGTKFNATKKPVPNLERFFKGRLKTKSRPVSLFGRKGLRREDGSREPEDYYMFGGSMYPGSPIFSAGGHHPSISLAEVEPLLVHMGDALEAHSAQFTPLEAWARHRSAHWCFMFGTPPLHIHDLADRTPAEKRLPLILDVAYGGLEHVLQPTHMGWLNYWSAEVCEYVDFPRALQGSPVFDLCYRTPRGAWIVKLSEVPLEPKNDHHTELLREMYERFPRVGVRRQWEDALVWIRPELPHLPGGERLS